eukprot:CAMPEP_0175140630 /NCGR_PEP_ID=MMETSP0087-20121206/11626_1 /TAXON_ID=136419 /ORGANISM="Unknown Unknown, Strain D1" /LENGTH=422 /DNA_ID=CAMNT_0016423895 /DNA_START=129 /DNA_END=1397 /DNA_ORIENTATION=+
MADCTVIVSNISPQLEENHLRELFECCGTIAHLALNKALGTCTVAFAESTHARAAVFLSGTTLGDRPLTVAIAPPPQPQMPVPPQFNAAAGINPQRLAMINGPPGGNPGGMLPNVQYAPNPNDLAMQNEKKMEEVARTVYIGNVNCSLPDAQLREYLTQTCGPIVIMKMAGETVGKPSRFAFVEFTTVEAAQKCITIDGAPLAGLNLKIRKANNAILKPSAPPASVAAGKDVSEIMRKVLAHTNSIGAKVSSKQEAAAEVAAAAAETETGTGTGTDVTVTAVGIAIETETEGDEAAGAAAVTETGEAQAQGKMTAHATTAARLATCLGIAVSPATVLLARKKGMSSKAANDEHAGMYFNGYKWEPIETLNQAQAAPGQVNPAMPLGNVRAVMMQQQQAMAAAAQGAPLPPEAMPGMPGQLGL